LLWLQDKPAIKLTFGKFQQIAVLAGQSTFVCDVVVENLTDKPVPRASFTVYGNDKNNVQPPAAGKGSFAVHLCGRTGQSDALSQEGHAGRAWRQDDSAESALRSAGRKAQSRWARCGHDAGDGQTYYWEP
jgi:hypothetical protein